MRRGGENGDGPRREFERAEQAGKAAADDQNVRFGHCWALLLGLLLAVRALGFGA